jgi:tetratricopeptide (TPR) repeat protein
MSAATPKFCAQCGTALPEAARFCSACGSAVGAAGPATLPTPPRSWREQLPGLTVLVTFLVAGLAMWIGVLRGGPNAATAPRPPGPPPGATVDGQGMPADHPPVGLTDDAKQFLDQLTEKAEAAPGDASAWRNLAQVQARAAALDPSYGPRAVDSFRHVLNLAPDDADAVRALANVFYDQKRYADASAQYERYLELRPDDPNVRTDLATTYLYRQEVERAIATYKDVLAARPDFLQAHFNLGLAYEAQGERAQALASIAKARGLANDDTTRERIDRVVSEIEGREPGAVAGPGQPPPPAEDATAGADAPPAADYRAAVERGLRAHPILGRKISAIEWPDETRARVLVREFPMDAMPDFARNLFRARLETIIYDAKEQFAVTDERAIELVDATSGATLDQVTQ